MKTRITSTAIKPPNTMSSSTCLMLPSMKRAWSMINEAVTPSGKAGSSSAILALVPCATATVFCPDCLRTWSVTASSPLTRDRLRTSSKPSRTRAISRRRTEEPSGEVATIVSRTWSTFWNSARVRTLISRSPSSKWPAGTFRFSARSCCTTAPAVSPSASMRARSSSTRTSRVAPPLTSTAATPGTCSSAGRSTSSAYSRKADSEPAPRRVYVSTGAAETSKR
jgi:hypothetical protein